MTDDSRAHRRRFMHTVAAGGGLAIAGCIDGNGAQQPPQDFDQTTTETATDTGDETPDTEDSALDEGEYEVGIGIQLDQQALQGLQSEMQQLQQQLQEEEINQTEYQERAADLQEQRQQIVEDGITSMSDNIESETNIEILETYPSMGAVRVAGVPEDLVQTLEFDDVQAIVSAAVFAQAQQTTSAP